MKSAPSLLLTIAATSALFAASVAHAPVVRAQPAAAAERDSRTATEFGALIQRLSGPAGYFDTDNLISNEGSYLHPLTLFDRLGVRGGAYVGVGPDQNFGYMARVRPRVAFIVDIRRDNMLHHLLLKALFELSDNRAQYLAWWLGRPVPPDRERWRERVTRYGVPLSAADLATIERFHRAFITDGVTLRFTTAGRAPRDYYPTLGGLLLERDLAGNRASYLAREANFQFLRRMQRRNLVVPLVGDLGGPRALAAIGAELRRRGEQLSVLYTSNVEDCLIRDGRFPTYAAAVRALPRGERTVMVRSWFGGPTSHPAWVQGYYSTQLVQTVDSFAADSTVDRVRAYRDLVTRHYLSR